MVSEHPAFNRACVGSSPTGPTILPSSRQSGRYSDKVEVLGQYQLAGLPHSQVEILVGCRTQVTYFVDEESKGLRTGMVPPV